MFLSPPPPPNCDEAVNHQLPPCPLEGASGHVDIHCVEEIPQDAYYGCSTLTSVTVPDSATFIGGVRARAAAKPLRLEPPATRRWPRMANVISARPVACVCVSYAQRAFMDTPLTSVIIGNSVNSIHGVRLAMLFGRLASARSHTR